MAKGSRSRFILVLVGLLAIYEYTRPRLGKTFGGESSLEAKLAKIQEKLLEIESKAGAKPRNGASNSDVTASNIAAESTKNAERKAEEVKIPTEKKNTGKNTKQGKKPGKKTKTTESTSTTPKAEIADAPKTPEAETTINQNEESTITAEGEPTENTDNPKAETTESTTAPETNKAESLTSATDLKIAIFMTSHLSPLHKKFLMKCWPTAVREVPMIRNSNLIVYTSIDKEHHYFTDLPFNKTVIKKYKESKRLPMFMRKQQGAVLAMVDPFKPESQWFKDYDWVVRLNPDVVIRRDEWLLQQMRNESIDGIFAEFLKKDGRQWIHTDFYAFRPNAVDAEGLIKAYKKSWEDLKFHAETHIKSGVQKILDSGRYAWLPNVIHRGKAARLEGRKCDVIHVHHLHEYCPHYLNATDKKHF